MTNWPFATFAGKTSSYRAKQNSDEEGNQKGDESEEGNRSAESDEWEKSEKCRLSPRTRSNESGFDGLPPSTVTSANLKLVFDVEYRPPDWAASERRVLEISKI